MKVFYFGLDPVRCQLPVELIHLPLIQTKMRPINDLLLSLRKLKKPTRLLFTSRSAVEYFFQLIAADNRFLYLKKLPAIAIGSATKALAVQKRLAVTASKVATQEGMISMICPNQTYLWPRSSRSRDLLKCQYPQQILELNCYDTLPVKPSSLSFAAMKGVVFTSPSTVDAFCNLAIGLPLKVIIFAIGPVTREYLLSKFPFHSIFEIPYNLH